MPSIGGVEMLVIAIVAIVVVGPKDLPKLLRGFGNFTRQIRAMARDFQDSIDDLARESELQDLREQIDDVRKKNILADAKKTVEDAVSPISNESIDLDTPEKTDTPPEEKPVSAAALEGDEENVHTVRPDMAERAS